MVQDSYRGMWFGTKERMRWIPAPSSGADVSPQGWSTSNVYLNGGGWARSSWGSYRQYQYAWSDASAREVAQIIHSYADGTFGRGLIYFIDPLTYNTNVLPKHLADPSLACNGEMPALQAVNPEQAPGTAVNNYPLFGASYTVTNQAEMTGYSAYIPIPAGFDLYIGAKYTATGTASVMVTPVNTSGGDLPAVALPQGTVTDASRFSNTFSGDSYGGVRVWLGKSSTAASTAVLYGMNAQLVPSGTQPSAETFWIGGQGHSGVRFAGKPTYIEYNSVGGGQVGYAATFIETGAWE